MPRAPQKQFGVTMTCLWNGEEHIPSRSCSNAAWIRLPGTISKAFRSLGLLEQSFVAGFSSGNVAKVWGAHGFLLVLFSKSKAGHCEEGDHTHLDWLGLFAAWLTTNIYIYNYACEFSPTWSVAPGA